MTFYLVIIIELLTLFFTSKYLIQALYKIFYAVFRKTHPAAISVFVVFFPGVIIHELAHLLSAELLRVRTGEFEVAPRIEANGLKMGSVQVAKSDVFRSAIIGVAPVIFGTAVLSIVLFFFTKIVSPGAIFSSWQNAGLALIVLWVVFVVTNTMFSSKKDVEGVAELGIALVFVVVILLIMLVILKVDFLPSLLAFLENQWLVENLRMIAVLLGVPVVLNLILLFLAQFIVKKIY